MFDLINLVLAFIPAFSPVYVFGYWYFKTNFYRELETTEKKGIGEWSMIFFAHLGIFYILVIIPTISTISVFNFLKISTARFDYLIGWLLGVLLGVIIPYKLKSTKK